MSLDSATAALDRRDFAAALQGLLPLWEETRDPTVEKAVVLADRAATPLTEAWRAAKRAEMHGGCRIRSLKRLRWGDWRRRGAWRGWSGCWPHRQIEREWMQPPRRAQVDAAQRADLVLTIG